MKRQQNICNLIYWHTLDSKENAAVLPLLGPKKLLFLIKLNCQESKT
jgi:hypothetical protein